jgi:hypothetical protein
MTTVRQIQAAHRRQIREAQKRQRDLERRLKEQAKLSALEQARLAVETHENLLEVLLSIHKEQGETWDWMAIASQLPPPAPQRHSHHELKARRNALVAFSQSKQLSDAATEKARADDEAEFQEALKEHTEATAEVEKMRCLARRILTHEPKAYIEALSELGPFKEMADLGSSLGFTIHGAKVLECELKIKGTHAIPSEVKALTSAGKLSVKQMSKIRFHEIYQDYVCACMLRVAREVFVLLPVNTVLVTAVAEMLNSGTGHTEEQPVLSAIMPRTVVEKLNFAQLDPSDALEGFTHRGDFKASRKSGAFLPIKPLTPDDIPQLKVEDQPFDEAVGHVQQLRASLAAESKVINQRQAELLEEDIA